MKKLRTVASLILLTALLMSIGLLNVSAEEAAKGLDFNDLTYYESVSTTLTLPRTYEATICLPKDFSGRGGVIIGTYGGAVVPLFNFEIHENGSPRVYINGNDTARTNYDIIFSDVHVATGKPTHVAITMEYETGTWSCYVDGVLMQTIVKPAPVPYKFDSKIRLGGDLRPDSSQYFKGILQKVALYSDVRTAQEVASDATADTFASDKLLCSYDLSMNDVGNYPGTIRSAVSTAPAFQYYNWWIKDLPEPENYAYSFAVIGDIQSLTYYYPDRLPTMYEWLRDNAESKKIKFAIGLGDITDKNGVDEYKLVNEVYAKIDGVIPFSIIRGNHDRSGTSSARYDTYITQKLYGDEISGSYDKTMLNTYRIIQIGNIKYLFMNLDFLLKDEVIAWANQVISENRDCHVIVSTHIYFNYAGKFYTLTGDSGIGTKYGCVNNGEDLWNKLVSKHENIVMMLCGHNPTDNIYYQQRKGVNGNIVTEILIDPQQTDIDFLGTGLVAMFYFSEDGKQLEVQYYSTIRDAYFKPNNQFKLTLDIPELGAEVPSTTETTAPVTTEPAITEEPQTETTPGTETTAPDVTEPVTDDTTTAPRNDTKKDGNGGMTAAYIAVAVLVVVGVGVCVIFGKKK